MKGFKQILDIISYLLTGDKGYAIFHFLPKPFNRR